MKGIRERSANDDHWIVHCVRDCVHLGMGLPPLGFFLWLISLWMFFTGMSERRRA
jgi:hypothetical protein